MSRPSLALVVLAIALATVAVAGAVAQVDHGVTTPLQEATSGEPNYLAMNASDVRTTNTTAVDLDVGASISADSSSVQATYLRVQFEKAYANASTDEARAQVVQRFEDRLENRTAALEARNRASIEAYASGSITAERFLRERARINDRADRLQATVSNIAEPLPRSVGNAFRNVNGRLEVLQGPISARTIETLETGGSPSPTYVEVSNSGYTLATVTDSEYTRETYLGEELRRDQPDQFVENTTNAVTAAQARAMELYPWVRLNHAGGSAFDLGDGTYRIRRALPTGELTVYLSGGTTNVFREAQQRSLASFNTTQSVNRTEGSVRLTVNRTFATGPAEVRLWDTVTNTPANGTIAIGDRDPRWVGDDGRLWIVEPRGDVQLNATVGSTRISTSLSGS